VEGAVSVCVVGVDERARELERAALRGFAVNRSVVRLRDLSALPPALAETLPHLGASGGSVALVCLGMSCLPPVSDVAELVEVLG